MPGLSIRANGSSLPLVLIERIAHVRGGSGLPSPPPAGAPPPKGEARLGSPLGGAGTAAAVTERATALPSGKGAGNQRLPGCFPSFLSCAARL